MDILLHDDNNLFMFIKSKNLITRNLTPKQQQQPQQQQNPPPPPKKHTTYSFWKGWQRANFLKVKSSCWVCIGRNHTDESQKSFQ